MSISDFKNFDAVVLTRKPRLPRKLKKRLKAQGVDVRAYAIQYQLDRRRVKSEQHRKYADMLCAKFFKAFPSLHGALSEVCKPDALTGFPGVDPMDFGLPDFRKMPVGHIMDMKNDAMAQMISGPYEILIPTVDPVFMPERRLHDILDIESVTRIDVSAHIASLMDPERAA